MEVLSVRDYRNNLSASFDRAAEGECVLIRRKNALYALVSVGSEDLSLSPQQQRQVDEMAESISFHLGCYNGIGYYPCSS